MSLQLINIPTTRIHRLARKVGARIDRENPARKVRKMVVVGMGLAFILFGALAETYIRGEWTTEVVLLVSALLLFAEESLRLKHRAPRRKWRELVLVSGLSVVLFLFVPAALWFDGQEEDLAIFAIPFGVLAVLSVVAFGYCMWRFRRLKREIEEEKEQLWRRYERQKRLEKRNTL